MVTIEGSKQKDIDLSNIMYANNDISKFNESVINVNDTVFNSNDISKLYEKGNKETAIANYYQNYGVCD